jgi:hypothetical protein
MDWLVWEQSKGKEIDFRYNANINQVAEWETQKADFQLKIDNSEKQYQMTVTENRKHFEKEGIFTQEQINEFAIRKSEGEKQRIEKEKQNWLKEVERLNNLIKEIEQFLIINSGEDVQKPLFAIVTNIDYPINGAENNKPINISISDLNKKISIKNAVENTTDAERYDIIHKHIKEVRIFNEPKGVKRIEIYFYEGNPKTFFYAGFQKNKSKKLYYYENETVKYLEYTKRFE